MEVYQMNYSKEYIYSIAEQTGFIANNIEKVIRLLDVLDFNFSKSTFKDALSLKGGTAINLVYTNLIRLSVDIDLDYHRHLDKEQTAKDREIILQELDEYMELNGYTNSNKSRGSAILDSRTYSYTNASGNADNIKVEINFIDRIGLLPSTVKEIDYFGKKVKIICPSKEELYGMKISATIDRSKPRDLDDANYLFENLDDIDLNTLKKVAVFYLSLDGIYKINEELFESIEAINYHAIKKELLPVLKKHNNFNIEKAKERVIKNLSDLLRLSPEEIKYLDEFSKGNYNPNLLFDEPTATRASNHPMAKWRIISIQKR